MPDKIHLRDHLTLDPARGTFDFVFRAQTILQNATAQVNYRDARGNAQRLSLAGDKVAYGIAENRVTMSRRQGAVELTWNATLVMNRTSGSMSSTAAASRFTSMNLTSSRSTPNAARA